MWVTVQVPGSAEPLNFLFDSGAEVSTLNLETARRLNLKGGQPVKVAGVGSRSTGYWPQKLDASASGVRLPSRFLVTDLCALQASCQCPVDGLLGADFFQDRIVQIDFSRKRIKLLDAVPAAEPGESLPIRFRRNIMQVPVTVDAKQNQWVRLDTGCASALEWVCEDRARAAKSARLSIALRAVEIPTARTSVTMAKWKFDHVHTGLHRNPIFVSESGLLGLGLLHRFECVTIDTKGKRLVLSSSLP